jgi:predicted RNase H-like HicB family nuclease
MLQSNKEMELNYAVVFLYSENQYTISVPDLPGCSVISKSIDLGMEQVTSVIQSHLTILAEYGEKIPNAKSLERHRENFKLDNPHTFMQAFWAIINIDITPYLGKSHKINVTLPEILIAQIDNKVSKSTSYKTRSGFIAKACIRELES